MQSLPPLNLAPPLSPLQLYRLQAAKHNRRLLAYLGLAAVIHAVGVWVLLFGYPKLNRFNQAAKDAPTPIDFVYINPQTESRPAEPPPTARKSQVNSTAGKQAAPQRPIQAGRSQPAAALLQPSRQASAPSPALPAQTPSQRAPVPSPVLPSPRQTVPASPLPPTSTAQPATQPSATQPSATQPTTAQPDRSSPYRLSSNQGLGNQLNAARVGTGSNVDAVQDARWGSYLASVSSAVDAQWQSKNQIVASSIRQTILRLRIERAGGLMHVDLVQPSGDDLADQAAIEAVKAAAPFAPLPQDAEEQVLNINFTFTLTPSNLQPSSQPSSQRMGQ
jgi:periplasmic protein TonB